MKKLLVLGSDYFTLSVVQVAQEMGLYVVVTDLMPTSPTKEAADEAWMVSTADLDRLEELCRKNGISAIMYGASDFNVSNARILCKRLGLPMYCADELPWSASRNKGLFKQYCKENGVRVPDDYYFSSDELTDEEIDKVRFPVVVKPVDKSGNRGISFCNSKEELREGYRAAREISDNPTIIVEKKLSGSTHNICYVVASGEIRLISYTESSHDAEQPHYVYSFSRNTNRFLKQYIEDVNEGVIKTFKALGCKDGIVWVDAIRDEEEKMFYILEMGYRFPAAVASCPLYERTSGFNPVRWMIECALGVKHNANNMPAGLTAPYTSFTALAYMFTKKIGIISRIQGIGMIKSLPNVFIDMPKGIGAQTRELATIALFHIYAQDCWELVDTLKRINDCFRVYDENGENLLIYFKDYDSIFATERESMLEYQEEME